ncbi:MAG: hypothetical protein K2G03_04110, partial [Bacilli bacterium]|nr:hypothetical protein [Bacilli bacterium]
MEENIDFLYEDIREALSNIDSIILGLSLSSISKPTLCVGAGGSKVVAEFANLVFTKKNKIICKTIDARDLNYIDLNLYSCLFVASYSGANTGVKLAMLKNLEKYLLTGRKSRISNETLIHYDLPKRHSFISLNATVVP